MNLNNYTFIQYKDEYSRLLEKHLNEYEDYSELSFIDAEIENYQLSLIDIEDILCSNDIEDILFKRSPNLYHELSNGRSEFLEQATKSNISSSLIIDFLENRKNQLLQISEKKKETPKLETEMVWFKVGLLFAENRLDEYIEINSKGTLVEKVDFTIPKIAEKLGNKGFNKYILGAIKNYPIEHTNADKNIFNNLGKMEKIIKYCNEYKIEICDFFMDKYHEKQQQLK